LENRVILGKNLALTSWPWSFLDQLELRATVSQTPLAGWITLIAGVFGGLALGKTASAILRHIGTTAGTHGWRLRSILFASIAGPANLTIIGLGLGIGVTGLCLPPIVGWYVGQSLVLIFLFALGWLVYHLVDILDAVLTDVTAKTASKLDDQLVPLVRKTLKVLVVIIFVLFAAENVFKANIGTWLAGLGIAGLAVSLAAQDSIKNIFGSVTILLDRPFHQGDVVTLAGQTGAIEEIGFRSTRMRTVDGALVTIPNAKVADSEVINLTAKPSLRRVLDVTIPCDTPPAKVEQALQIVREILAAPDFASAFDLKKEPPRVFFDELNADSLNIKVMYWFRPTDYWQFLGYNQRFNLALMRQFEAAGIELAFPTQTLYLAGDPRRKLAIDRPTQESA
jgi:MscS family membrane protein